MRADLRGLVERIELSTARGLFPLFEAVSNAMDAIAERFASPSQGQISIDLLERVDLATGGADAIVLFDGFRVTDNGAGFNEKNMTSFSEAYTLKKISVGGRGVGRFTYLKVFQDVHIRSVFERQGVRYLREFPSR